jgi:hypothetical protein
VKAPADPTQNRLSRRFQRTASLTETLGDTTLVTANAGPDSSVTVPGNPGNPPQTERLQIS